MTAVLTTPPECFADVPGHLWPATLHDVDDGLRMACVEAGPPDGRPVLLLHGEPTWSFLWRKTIAVLAEAGHRVLAPDLIGFGRSDKPLDVAAHSYSAHVGWLRALLDEIGLDDLGLVCQDWGGLLGLRILGEQPDRFRAVVAANTGLPNGHPMPPAFYAWRAYAARATKLDPGRVVDLGTVRPLDPAVRAAFNAPFPDERFLAGPRAMPALVPTSFRDPEAAVNRAAWHGLRRFSGPFVTAFSNRDPITVGGGLILRTFVRGAKGQTHVTIRGAGHFLQEDAGTTLGNVCLAALSGPGATSTV